MKLATTTDLEIRAGKYRLRRSRPDDVDAIVRLGMDGLNADPYPGLVIDPAKVRAVVVSCVSAPADFAWVAVDEGGKVVASVLATVHDMVFHERKQATVLQFWTEAPGAGAPLMRQFLRWARARRAIKSIVFTLECGADPRIGKLMHRLGLRQELPVWMETR